MNVTKVSFLAAAVALAVTLPLLADNIEGPWGIQNGDLFGRARSSTIPVQFQPSSTVQVAWSLPLGNYGLNRPGGMGYMVFDAAGNIYMRTSTASNTLASFDPNGNLRWRAHDSGGNNIALGTQFSATSPIVGDGAYVYMTGEGAEGLLAAVRKSDGLVVWQTVLTGEPVSTGGSMKTPTLYNGKLYVVGRNNSGTARVYQVDSTTGALNWAVSLPIGPTNSNNNTGSITLVPDVFGLGQHGLYFNMNSGSGIDGQGEVYGIKIDTAAQTATLAWWAEGGFANRSHVIYSPVTGRLYTVTSSDFGGELYSFDAVTGAVVVNQNVFNKGSATFDVAGLDFDNVSIVSSSQDGLIAKYTDVGGGVTTSQVYNYPSWWGELRIFGQLLQQSGHTILATGTNSRCDLTHPAEFVLVDVNAASLGEDGPLYIDDISVQQGPDEFNLTPVYSENFEALALGNLPGQGGWVADNVAPGGVTPAQLVSDPGAAGQGKVARLDAVGNFGGWQGVFHDFADTTADTVVITWKQYRPDLTDAVWAYFGNSAGDLSGGWTYAWDAATPAPAYFPYHFAGDATARVGQTAGLWQTVTITYRYLVSQFPDAREVVVSITDANGTLTGTVVAQQAGFNATDAIRGIGFDLQGTPIISGGTPNPILARFNSNVCSDNAYPLRGGPLVGPDGKAYYASPTDNTLYALQAVNSPIVVTRGDANCDGAVNFRDINPFVLAVSDPAGYQAAFPGCDILTNDANDDGQVTFRDINPFVGLLAAAK